MSTWPAIFYLFFGYLPWYFPNAMFSPNDTFVLHASIGIYEGVTLSNGRNESTPAKSVNPGK